MKLLVDVESNSVVGLQVLDGNIALFKILKGVTQKSNDF
jgi:hypothetical protein